jgi:hypothetical protein
LVTPSLQRWKTELTGKSKASELIEETGSSPETQLYVLLHLARG